MSRDVAVSVKPADIPYDIASSWHTRSVRPTKKAWATPIITTASGSGQGPCTINRFTQLMHIPMGACNVTHAADVLESQAQASLSHPVNQVKSSGGVAR